MRFKLRSQFIPKTVTEQDQHDLTELSISVDLSIDNEQLLNSKGHLFATVSIKTKNDTNIYNMIKIFLENLKDGYYQYSDETPIHTLEKELKKSIDLISFYDEEQTNIELFSVCTAVIWNKVLYIGYYGDGSAYLVRGNGVRSLKSSNNPNEIWTNSCLLMSQDVIIIGTKQFGTIFTTRKIVENISNLSLLINQEFVENNFGSIIIKYQNQEEDVKNDQIINVQESVEKNLDLLGVKFSNYFNFRKSLNQAKENLVTNQVQSKTPVFSINSNILDSKTSQEALLNKFRYQRLAVHKKDDKKSNNFKLITIVSSLIFLISLAIWAIFMLINRTDINNQITEQSVIEGGQSGELLNDELLSNTEKVDEANDSLDNLIFVEKFISTEKDFKDSYFNDISVFNDQLIIVDENKKSVIGFNIKTKQNKEILKDLENPTLVTCTDELCYLLDNSNIIVFDPSKIGVFDKIFYEKSSDVKDIGTLGVNLYLLLNNSIDKYDNTVGKLSTWSESVVPDSISLAVDDGIYALQNRGVVRYFRGELVDNYKLDNVSNLIKSREIKYKDDTLYIYDEVTKSVSLYKPNGVFITNKKIISKNYTKLLKSFDISSDGKIYFVIGNDIYTLKI